MIVCRIKDDSINVRVSNLRMNCLSQKSQILDQIYYLSKTLSGRLNTEVAYQAYGRKGLTGA